MNNEKTNETRNETKAISNGLNTDSSWMHIIILLLLLCTFPSPVGQKVDWAEVIKGAAKTIGDFEKSEEVKPDEN